MIQVPPDVIREAVKGLKWRSKFGRGGTQVGISTALSLVSGKVSVEKVKHISKYFPRHAWERKLWWRKKDPSNGRIAWALWGGDAGRAWAKRVLEGYSK